MTLVNGYVTLATYKTWPDIESTDATDDGVIEQLIQASSRYIDNKSQRWYFPRVRLRHYDIPRSNVLKLKGDLLEVISFINGDDTTISSSDYLLNPPDDYPKYELELQAYSSVYWQLDTNRGSRQVLDLTGIEAFHNSYSERAWSVGGTLGAAITSTTALTATLTAGHACVTGQIWRIDNEILNGSISSNTATFLVRGDNGSTAATHLNGATIYYWNPQDDIKEAVIMLVASLEKRRAGESISSETIATAAGVLITPRDVPGFTADVISNYTRRT